jgi:hypothetical protein
MTVKNIYFATNNGKHENIFDLYYEWDNDKIPSTSRVIK